jgi:hypothetical protein
MVSDGSDELFIPANVTKNRKARGCVASNLGVMVSQRARPNGPHSPANPGTCLHSIAGASSANSDEVPFISASRRVSAFRKHNYGAVTSRIQFFFATRF